MHGRRHDDSRQTEDGSSGMKRIGVAGFGALLASLALASSAVAAEYPVTALPQLGRCALVGKLKGDWVGNKCQVLNPGKGSYEWTEGAEKKKFEGASVETVTLEPSTNPAHKIQCAAATAYNGEYTGAKTATVNLNVVGCTLPATKQKCQTSPLPQKEGEIEITGGSELGFIKAGE